MSNNRLPLIAVLVLLLAFGGVMTLPLVAVGRGTIVAQPVNHGDPGPFPADSPIEQFVPCAAADQSYYYFDFNGKESPRSFGPSAEGADVVVTVAEFMYRLCGDVVIGGDEALYRALDAVVHGTDPNRALSTSEWQRGVRQFAYDVDPMSARLVQETSQSGTYSLYMDKDNNGVVKIGAVQIKPRTSWFLAIMIDGVSVKLRLACGYQPEMTWDNLPVALK